MKGRNECADDDDENLEEEGCAVGTNGQINLITVNVRYSRKSVS